MSATEPPPAADMERETGTAAAGPRLLAALHRHGLGKRLPGRGRVRRPVEPHRAHLRRRRIPGDDLLAALHRVRVQPMRRARPHVSRAVPRGALSDRRLDRVGNAPAGAIRDVQAGYAAIDGRYRAVLLPLPRERAGEVVLKP